MSVVASKRYSPILDHVLVRWDECHVVLHLLFLSNLLSSLNNLESILLLALPFGRHRSLLCLGWSSWHCIFCCWDLQPLGGLASFFSGILGPVKGPGGRAEEFGVEFGFAARVCFFFPHG
jgi:hypothetical protein